MKKTIKIVCFCLLLIFILKRADGIFAVKYGDGIYNMTKFYELDNNTVDTLILGSSHAFEDINTGVLWDNYGIASFVLGGSVQPLWNTYYYLKEALKTQKPQLIILEAFCTCFTSEYSDDSYMIKNTYGIKWSKDRVEAIKVSAPKERWMEFLLSYVQYHTRYTELSEEDFLANKGDISYENWKGFGCNMETEAFETPHISTFSERVPMTEKTEKYYRKTIELALANDIPILVVVSPYAGITEWEQGIFNTASDIAEEYGINFINYNLLYEEVGIDFSCDVADFWHLNYKGNQKYTKALGDYITKYYKITDRRADGRYQSWETEARYIEGIIKNQQLKEVQDSADIVERLQNPNYVLYISVDGNCTTADEYLAGFFNRFGIPPDNSNGCWVITANDGILYASGNTDAKLYMNVDCHDICLDRSWDESKQMYLNSVILDHNSYIKVNNGVNILVYDTISQTVADSFGIDKDNLYCLVR